MKATADYRSAFSDSWNILFISIYGILAILLLYMSLTNVWLFFVWAFVFFMLVMQIWGMLTIRIEVDDEKLQYFAAKRHVILLWHEIESVMFEPFKKQITFRRQGKIVRIHEFGLNPQEYEPVKNAILQYITQHNITILSPQLKREPVFAHFMILLVSSFTVAFVTNHNVVSVLEGSEAIRVGYLIGQTAFYMVIPIVLVASSAGIYRVIVRKSMPSHYIVLGVSVCWLLWVSAMYSVINLSGG